MSKRKPLCHFLYFTYTSTFQLLLHLYYIPITFLLHSLVEEIMVLCYNKDVLLIREGYFMQIIGITGKSGSGKSTFASLLAKKLNCIPIDIDKIGHQALLDPNILTALSQKFGNEIFDNEGKLDRKKIGDIVFTRKRKNEAII